MKYLKNFGFSLLYMILTVLITTGIIATLSYFNLISDKVVSIFKIIIPILGFLIGGFNIGKKSNKKGFIEGLKLGLLFIIIIIVFNYLAFDFSFKFKYLLFYLILIISSTLGSMIGISRKKD